MKIIYRILLAVLLPCLTLAQSNKSSNDVVLILNENVINKLFKIIGEISGTNAYKIGFITGTYTWTMQPATIELIKDSARFITDVNVKAGPISYTTQVPGKVSIQYLEKKNKIQLTVVDAVFEIYTHILGKKIHIKNIQLADYFKEPFLFEGPANIETDMDFTMPDGTIKKIYTKTENCKLKIEPHQIVLNSQLIFYEKSKN
jgi:hypothetical protein